MAEALLQAIQELGHAQFDYLYHSEEGYKELCQKIDVLAEENGYKPTNLGIAAYLSGFVAAFTSIKENWPLLK